MNEDDELKELTYFRKLRESEKNWFLLGKETGRKEIINAIVELFGIQKMIDKSIEDSKSFSDDDY